MMDMHFVRLTQPLLHRNHPVTLDVTEVIPAGSVPTYPITEGKAARIMTGAPVPEGADAIIMHERTSFTENTVTLTAPVTSANIIPPGEDVKARNFACSKRQNTYRF